jgi:hypothetical protein
MTAAHLACIAVFALAAACGSDSSASSSTGAAPDGGVPSYFPDVPTWRGGCFFDLPVGQASGTSKIVNGSPSPDVRVFGRACDPQPGPGGLVYLDRYDPVAGTGDVTVLGSTQGSVPVVIGKNGGAGGILNGGAGARFDDQQTRVLTLADVSFVTGQLVVADLPSGAPSRLIADHVRVENYEFLPNGSVFFVGNYDAAKRVGDLLYWDDDAPQDPPRTVDSQASRFDFVMYRMAPGRRQVAYLKSWATAQGGDLFAQTLPPGPPPIARIDSEVLGMAWTADGQRLVYRTRNSDGVTYTLKAWDAGTREVRVVAGAPPGVGVSSSDVVGNDIVYADGWNLLSQQATLHVTPAAGGPEPFGPSSPVSLTYGVAQPPTADGAGALAFVGLPDPSDPFSGNLFLSAVPGGPGTLVDDSGRVSPEAGFHFGPRAGFVAWARDFRNPKSTGAGLQPGIATEVLIASMQGASRATLATSGSMQRISWDRLERWVAAVGSFQPAANRGDLIVMDTATGTQLFAAHRVAGLWFGFGADGTSLAAIRDWDDALQRGELVLVLATTSGASPWAEAPIDEDVTFYLEPRGGRVIYGVRGSGRDGLWLGGAW